jgi:hypothetical protein
MRRLFVSVLFASAASAALAATPAAPQAVVPPPPTVNAVPGDNPGEAEPEVRIVHEGEKTTEEYRINGKLYMVKVSPGGGMPPYYLMDEEGNGVLKQIDPARRVIIPQWVLVRF